MEYVDILRYLVDDIHTTVVATLDDQGLPVTAAIDMMMADEDGVYFLTAKGKPFYDRLTRRGFVALTGVKGEDTMRSVAVSLRGKVKEVPEVLPALLDRNPYMDEIYPTAAAKQALTAFCIYQGEGEYFDLSRRPIYRESFAYGVKPSLLGTYYITPDCIGCGNCLATCPQSCIELSCGRAYILQQHCLHCGNCYEVCPHGAVAKR